MTKEELELLLTNAAPPPALDMTLIFIWVTTVAVIAFALGFAVGVHTRAVKMILELTK
jgi:hypothetical protein